MCQVNVKEACICIQENWSKLSLFEFCSLVEIHNPFIEKEKMWTIKNSQVKLLFSSSFLIFSCQISLTFRSCLLIKHPFFIIQSIYNTCFVPKYCCKGRPVHCRVWMDDLVLKTSNFIAKCRRQITTSTENGRKEWRSHSSRCLQQKLKVFHLMAVACKKKVSL